MASLTRYSKGWKLRYRIYYPDGTSRLAFAYRTQRRDATLLKGQAEQLEALTQANRLTPDAATVFVHHKLFTADDQARCFPGRVTLAYDRAALLDAYERQCHTQMTSLAAMRTNRNRARHLTTRLGDLGQLTAEQVRQWQSTRVIEVARKTVNLDMDVLRQLLDLCVRLGWRHDNPARTVRHLSWRPTRLPKALTMPQVEHLLTLTQRLQERSPAVSLSAHLYRMSIAGIYFGLRRGELQHLLGTDTNGRQVYVQGKDLPGGGVWVPKDREARVITYAGIEGPIAIVFGTQAHTGYVFSTDPARQRPLSEHSLTRFMSRALREVGPGLTLHSLRHTFATWRIEQGDSLVRVQRLLGHADLKTLMRYAHVQPNPLADLLPLLSS